MDVPRVDGFEILELYDYGGCGEVYRAVDAAGRLVALKVFDDLSVSRTLLAKMTQRLTVDGWPRGVMPVLTDHLQRSPLYQVMPWMADADEDGSWTPRSLQHRIESISSLDAWQAIRLLAHALGQMHVRHVPHGNLKPGNIFQDGHGGILLSDWCLGNMPGVHVFHFTDALLYQPPEQLLDASGYLDEQGYAWDVFAFGVIAFRLLTGEFPRCHDAFRKVSPAQGLTRCEGMKADPQKIAANLLTAEICEWPTGPKDELERRMRESIVCCLNIDPAHRPVSMTEVCAGFELTEKEVAKETEQQRLIELSRRLKRRVRGLAFFLFSALIAVLVFAGLWRCEQERLKDEISRGAKVRETLRADANDARTSETVALRNADEARRVMLYEREQHALHLEASRLIGDQLFAWAIESGRRRLPPLDGQNVRLKRLEQYFVDFAEQSKDVPTLAQERARIMLQLAEISIAKADADEASQRYEVALEVWKSLPKDAEMKLRLATNSLLIAILHEARSPSEALAAYKVARAALAGVPRAEVDVNRFDQLLAVLDFREAKWLVETSKDKQALEQLLRATQALNRLSGQRPDVAILRSALADCYLSAAVILDGLGRLGDAREVRQLASEVLVKLQKENPSDLAIQFELVSCYAAMAEVALMSGDLEAAGTRSSQALQMLKIYAVQRPRDDEALIKKAEVLGLQAGVKRDLTKPAEALVLYDEALLLLNEVHERKPEQAMASYRLALIWWQKGRMPGTQGDGGDMEMMQKASLLLAELVKAADARGPNAEQLMRSRAYLEVDLGHAFQLNKQNDKAKVAFNNALEYWQKLVGLRPESEEYLLGEDWCREQLQEIK